jgi:hypothetical protein
MEWHNTKVETMGFVAATVVAIKVVVEVNVAVVVVVAVVAVVVMAVFGRYVVHLHQ